MYQKTLIITVILAALAVACGPTPSPQLEANRALVQRFTKALNAGDLDALDDLMTEDFRRYCQATPGVEINSREDFKKLQESFLVSMPDQKIKVEMLIAEGDKVAAYATYTGTLTGPMGDFPPTGKSADSKFMTIFRIEKGRIAEIWVEWDNLAMLTQLGLFPPPAAPAEAPDAATPAE